MDQISIKTMSIFAFESVKKTLMLTHPDSDISFHLKTWFSIID